MLLYAGWTLLLVTVIVGWRGVLTLRGKPANSFAVDGSDVSPLSVRLMRAQMNCVENLPVFLGVAAVAVFSGNTAVCDPLALWVVVARLAQSLIHISSTSVPAVVARYTLFVFQVVVVWSWVLRLVLAGMRG